ncbi:tetraspanin-9-like [Crassostrea angulata]|uniref:tetraspanin-9-like n=1 Tax=Magallana angulata TaxID=2784310 RepID=UPI0022B0DF17|nr:tetraspanin-9-like [Crassostrea angulata]
MACNCKGIIGIAFLITNILLSLFGIGLIIVGALSDCEVSDIETDNTKPLLDLVLFDSFAAGRLAIDLSILNIIIGVVILVFSGVGIFWKYREIKKLLLVYTIIIAVVFVIHIIFIALWYTMINKVDGELKNKLVVSLKENFIEDTVTNLDPISNAWNHMFMTLDCCGVNSVESTSNDFDQTPWCTTVGSCQDNTSQIPRTCCIDVNEMTYPSAPNACHTNVTSGTYNAKGCFEVLKRKLLSQSPGSIGVVITIMLIGIINVTLAVAIGCHKD